MIFTAESAEEAENSNMLMSKNIKAGFRGELVFLSWSFEAVILALRSPRSLR
jgi:hypothetical protein